MTPEMQAALDEYLAATQQYAGQTYGQLTPAELQESALKGVQYDPRMLEYEMSALRALEEQGREGLTAQDKAAIAAAERQAGQAARGRRGAIEQGMRSRGISGSGLDLVAQLQSAESANELAAMKALEQGALSAQRRTQGQLQAGQMAGQIGTRQYQTEAEKAAAQDRIRQFNAQNRMGAQQFNIQSAQQQAANKLAAQQSAAQMKYNANVEAERARQMREEERRRRQAGGLAAGLGVLGAGLGAYASGGNPKGAVAGYTIGSGLGSAFSGYADGGRVSPYNLNLPGPTDVIPAMLTPGEMVLPTHVANNPDAAAQFVADQNKAEQEVAKAKEMRDIFGYADVAAKGLSDYAASQRRNTYLPRRLEELGKGPEVFQTQMPQYQAGSLAQLGELGVKKAQEDLGAAKEKFATSVGLEKYGREQKKAKELEDPTSPLSRNANLLLKSRLNALANEAEMAQDSQNAKALRELGRASNMSASQAMQTMQLVEGIDYKDALNAIAAKAKLDAETFKETKKEGRTEQGNVYDRSVKMGQEVEKVMKDTNALERNYNIAQNLVQSGQGTDDEALIVMFQKTLDPGSVVREGEFARTSSGQAIISQAQQFANSLATGQKLKPEMRQKILATMKTLLEGHRAGATAQVQKYRDAAKRYGLDEELIFGSQTKTPTPEKTIIDEDAQALNWARQNPTDPRAAEILEKLGVQNGQ